MIVISTPLTISSSVRDIERLLRESPPFKGGEDVNLVVRKLHGHNYVIANKNGSGSRRVIQSFSSALFVSLIAGFALLPFIGVGALGAVSTYGFERRLSETKVGQPNVSRWQASRPIVPQQATQLGQTQPVQLSCSSRRR